MPPKKGRGKKPGPKKKKEEKFVLPKQIGVWVWAQCDNAGCQKWRKLPPGTVINDNEPWFCYMNPNEDMNDCNIPEEAYNMQTEAAIYSIPPSQAHSEDSEPDDASWDSQNESRGKRTRRDARISGRSSGAAQSLLQPQHPIDHRDSLPGDDYNADGAPRPQSDDVDDGAMLREVPQAKAKTKKAHLGFNKILATGGSWDESKAGVKALTATPSYVWDAMAVHAPDSARTACQAVDRATATQYFEQPSLVGSAQQVEEATQTARLALSLAAALGASATSQIPGIESPPAVAPDPAQQQHNSLPQANPGNAMYQPPAPDLTQNHMPPWQQQQQPHNAAALPSAAPELDTSALPNSMEFDEPYTRNDIGAMQPSQMLNIAVSGPAYGTHHADSSQALPSQTPTPPPLDRLMANDAALTQSKDGWRPNGMGDLTGHFMPATFGDQIAGAQQATQQAQEPLFGLHGGTNGFLQDNWIPNLDFTGLGLAPELEYASKLAPGPEGLLADHNFFQQGQGEPNVATADLSRLQQSHQTPDIPGTQRSGM